ncbi:MAG: PHP domain-containing protein [Saprospiraceae bacterium]|nr:PHP domain-containing protein [Saprospiraceae bacterium]
MTNKEYASHFQILAQLMELHGENSYRIKSYNNAYRLIRSVDAPIHEMSLEQVKMIKGVGDAIGVKIQELRVDGKMKMLEEYKSQTPPGIVQLLNIKGIGVKKIKLLWEEMEILSPGELLYACQENRLINLKGFGQKSQNNIKQQLEYYFQSIDKYHYAKIEEEATNLVLDIQHLLNTDLVSLTGKIRRLVPILDAIAILIGQQNIQLLFDKELIKLINHEEGSSVYHCKTTEENIPVVICTSESDFWGYNLLRTTGNENFNTELFSDNFDDAVDWRKNNPEQFRGLSEEQIFDRAGLPFIEPEIRDIHKIILKIKNGYTPKLIQEKDICGVLHAHSTWSDGSNSLEEMASYVKEQGFEYLGITDHSKSAFYANGLQVNRVLKQMEEIDQLNKKMAPFRIFKGIESDILYDGSLDYDPEILRKFDFVIASIHSTLRMDKNKATERLIRAIKNPYTTILGHPTGRILLSRKGYPIDHKAVINACAEHNVIIEINSNPLRLDLDYKWVPYALEKGVKIAINPDAHNLAGIHDIHFGVLVARKGALNKEMCINTLNKSEFETILKKQKELII